MNRKMTFEEWKQAVDNFLIRVYGLDSEGLNDWSYLDDYNRGVTPQASARRAVNNAKNS